MKFQNEMLNITLRAKYLGTIDNVTYTENEKCDPKDFENKEALDCPNLNATSACIFYARNQPSGAIYMQVVQNVFSLLAIMINEYIML